MARRVFFSFHYDRDVRRVVQVRNSWVVRPGGEAQPFYDKAEFEEAERRAGGIEKRIKRNYELGKGLLAIDIHSVKDPQLGTDRQGTNPLSYFTIKQNGRDIPLSNLYGTYDWVRDNGYANMPAWIETAAKAAGR